MTLHPPFASLCQDQQSTLEVDNCDEFLISCPHHSFGVSCDGGEHHRIMFAWRTNPVDSMYAAYGFNHSKGKYSLGLRECKRTE